MPQYTPEEMAERADFYLNKKGLKDRAQAVKDKQEVFEKAAKKYGVTQEQFQRGIFPDEVKELYEDYAKHDLMLNRAVQWNIENDAKEAGGYDKSGEALENEFNGYVATKEASAEQLKKLDELQENYNARQDLTSLSQLVKAQLEITPNAESEEQERKNLVGEAMDRLREKTINDEASSLAKQEIRSVEHKNSIESDYEKLDTDKRTRMYERKRLSNEHKTPLEVEIIERKNQLVREAGYEQDN